MPKEITHWAIATTAKTRVSDQQVRSLLDKHYAAFLVGAIAYDIPYYAGGRGRSQLLKRAGELHRADNCHVREPLMRVIQHYAKDREDELPGELVAFLAGCMSHIAIDSGFHPFIYYYTGNSYAEDRNNQNKAVYEHRQLETQLDLYYLEKLNYTGPSDAHQIVSQLQASWIVEVLAQLYFENGDSSRILRTKECLYSYTRAQGLFHNALIKYALKIAGIISPSLRNISALFYSKAVEPAYYHLFENTKQYRHPVTGELVKESLEEIFNRCVAALAANFTQIFYHKTAKKLITLMGEMPDISLESGEVCQNPVLMEYFAETSITGGHGI